MRLRREPRSTRAPRLCRVSGSLTARALAGVWLLAGASPASAQARAEFIEVHMGVPVRVVVHAVDDVVAREAARAAYARIAELDAIMSDYRAESEVRRVSGRGDGMRWHHVSGELFEVLALALAIARVSDGAFDPTVGPLVALWRDARRERRLPSADVLARARARVGWQAVELNSPRRAVRLTRDSMRLDLGGIAKGYILQAALEVLRRRGITSALLEAGGDLVLGAAPPGQDGWVVEIGGRDTVLSQVAVATSGPTEQYIEISGVRYSHVIDVRTGLGAAFGGTAQSITVIAEGGATADAVATALSVADRDRYQALRAFPGVRCVRIVETPFPAGRR